MEWDYEKGLEGIATASVENWKSIRYGECIICGNKDIGYYDLCQNCYDKPIPDYNAFHVGQLFSTLHKAVLLDMEKKMCCAYNDGDARPAVQAYRDFCFSYGTPGRIYYNDQKQKANRSKNPTQGSPADLLKRFG